MVNEVQEVPEFAVEDASAQVASEVMDPDALARSLPAPMVFVDLETTGGNALEDRITEIGVVEVGPHGVEQWSTLLDPAEPIPPFIQQLTGITNEMVRGQPSFATLAEGLAERLHGKLFVAHNARFDYGFLKNEFRRAGISFQADVLCTVRLSRLLFPSAARHGLDALIARFGLTPLGRHRALADADLLWQFWQKLHTIYAPDLIGQAVQRVTKRSSQPPQLPDEAIDALPDSPGVYLFYGEGDTLLYVGKSVDIRSRVRSHFSSDHQVAKDLRISQEIRRVEARQTTGELGALLLESQLVKQLQPVHNRQLRRTSSLYSWQLAADSDTPQLVSAKTVDFASAEALYGTFSSRASAESALRALADEHRLCCAQLGLEKAAGGRPCFGYQVKRCDGACVGDVPLAAHTARVREALTTLQLDTWPYDGPIAIEEHGTGTRADDVEYHVIDRWQYLGSVTSREALDTLVDSMPAVTGFDPDIYRLLGRRLAASRQASDPAATDTAVLPSPGPTPTPARRAHTPLVVLQLSRPAFRLSPVEPPEKPPSKRAVALLRRRQPRPEDPAQIRLPFDAH
ncbi:ethanolamine utilization protein [Pandoraea apista]|uniref:exonuclease domain-containing protein n=1 Tax=Pandoraea apista TaxID=93218 RepID=UPI0005DA1243|nr:exonuclease domain-containing protein [Pandoraea apista]AJZ74754.1 ethanolamine utilization protein [Pandoraea apista]AKH71267.1 ethanolamine utilization protein [Pandoraea apista]AKI63539.1 ethanolamine utilization protein [Pandoraea apista]AVF41912.1 ethanolamine utilization protein [Pandoraea apista]